MKRPSLLIRPGLEPHTSSCILWWVPASPVTSAKLWEQAAVALPSLTPLGSASGFSPDAHAAAETTEA